jgi:Protein of unknown function (DUF3426)
MFTMRIVRGATLVTFLVGLAACAGTRGPSYPIPDEPGLYALTSGDNLHRLDGDREWEIETWPERSDMPSGVQFVVSDPGLVGRPAGTVIELWRVAWVRSEINAANQAMPVEGSQWATAPLDPFRIPFRYESEPDQTDVVHIVPTTPLEPGLYTLRIVGPGAQQARVGVAWSSVDRRQYSAANCVDRYSAEGNVYRACTTTVGTPTAAKPPTGGTSSTNAGVSGSGGLTSLSAPAPTTTPAPTTPAPPAAQPPQPAQPAATSARGLNIVLVDPVRQNDGLLVQGVVVNSSSQPQVVPAMQGSLENQAGQEVRRWVFNPPVRQLGPGQRANFKTEVRPLPAGVARATVAFISTAQ